MFPAKYDKMGRALEDKSTLSDKLIAYLLLSNGFRRLLCMFFEVLIHITLGIILNNKNYLIRLDDQRVVLCLLYLKCIQ